VASALEPAGPWRFGNETDFVTKRFTTCMEKIAMQTNYVRTCCTLILMDWWRGLPDARA
jgi:hypothetical protein